MLVDALNQNTLRQQVKPDPPLGYNPTVESTSCKSKQKIATFLNQLKKRPSPQERTAEQASQLAADWQAITKAQRVRFPGSIGSSALNALMRPR